MPMNSRFFNTSGVKSLISSVYLSCRCLGTFAFGTWDALVLDVCRNVPPVRPALFTISSVNSKKLPELSYCGSRTMSIKPPQPLLIPITLYPSRKARIVTALIAGFKPGTSPPPVRIPMIPLFFCCPIMYCFMLVKSN